MKIQVVTGKIKRKFEIPDSDPPAALIYTELPLMTRKRLVFQNLKNGKLSAESAIDMSYDFIKEMIVGWEGFHDEDGNPIEFKKEYLDGLSEEILQAFLDGVISPQVQPFFADDDAADPDEDEIKN